MITTKKETQEHIDKVLSLLEEQDYQTYGTSLTREERKSVFDLLRKSQVTTGFLPSAVTDYVLDDFDEVYSFINRSIYREMDEFTKNAISKCGVDPMRILVLKNKRLCINKNLYNSIKSVGIAIVGDYVIKRDFDCPIDNNSSDLEDLSDIEKAEISEKYANGVERYWLLKHKKGMNKDKKIAETEGKLLFDYNDYDLLYSHIGNLTEDDDVYFMDEQIAGDGSIWKCEDPKEMSDYLDDLTTFYSDLETILMKNSKEKTVKVKTRQNNIN